MSSPRYWRDKAYDEKRRQHPDYHFWRSRQWRDHIHCRGSARPMLSPELCKLLMDGPHANDKSKNLLCFGGAASVFVACAGTVPSSSRLAARAGDPGRSGSSSGALGRGPPASSESSERSRSSTSIATRARPSM